jgi:hypothetical protein
MASYGEPIEVGGFREVFERDEREAARQLTEIVRDRLEGLTLNFEAAEDEEVIEVAERLYARRKGMSRPRERDPMVDRIPRMQRFARGLRWLREEDPERLAELRNSVIRYRRLLTLFGATEGDVPSRYKLGRVLGYSLRQLGMLALVFPVAAFGALMWAPPFVFTGWAAPRFRPELDQIATYKVSIAIISYPVWFALLLAAVWLKGGASMVVLMAIVLPIAGLATVAWRDRQGVVREDLRVFLRVRGRTQSRARLAELRGQLVGEFDELAEAWRAAGEP